MTSELIKDILAHHGVKGMRWGLRRKATVGPQEVVVSDKRRSIKTSGGEGHAAHPDAIRVKKIGRIGKKSGHKALSNQELSEYTKRLQLEQSAKRLTFHDKNIAQKFVLTLLGQTGKSAATSVANEVATQQVKKHLIKIGLAAA